MRSGWVVCLLFLLGCELATAAVDLEEVVVAAQRKLLGQQTLSDADIRVIAV